MTDAPVDENYKPAEPVTQDAIEYYAKRPSAALDEVKLQADYCARSMISFWRFRELGGGARTGSEAPKIGEHSGKGIHYVSDHPEVRILSLSFIFLLVIFESAANAYFFARESEFGLFGGVFQAAAVSLANVATSYFIIGYWGLRHISVPLSSSDENSDSFGVAGLLIAIIGVVFALYAVMTYEVWWQFAVGIVVAGIGLIILVKNKIKDGRVYIKLFGLLAIGFGVITVLLVNLSAAHYRNILDLEALGMTFPDVKSTTFPRFFIEADVCEAVLTSDIGNTIGSAATNAMCRPFALHSLDAMVLFALGLAISALAAFEGRKADSAFPGLSDAARHFERSRRDLQDALDDYYDSYEDLLDEIEDDHGKGAMKAADKLDLRKAMDAAVEDYRAMLSTAPELLADEFDVDREVVALVQRGGKK